MNVLIIIPARGGSKGIPRKNLRPLNGRPLLYYSIQLGLSSRFSPDVYVSTDDEEIAYFAQKFGASIHHRDQTLGGDLVTLDPVIFEAYSTISKQRNKAYDFVITLQPTSPLLSVASLDAAIQQMVDKPALETILSAVNDTHLTWGKGETGFLPNYKARVNRQLLPPVYKETGGFFISRADIVTPKSRIGKNVDLFVVPTAEAIDIDSFEDWSLCEYFLKRKTILFCVTGYPEIGLGHVYNSLILAHQIMDHRVIFLFDSKSDLGVAKVQENNFEVHKQVSADIIDDILKLNPHVVVNDRLDTDAAYIQSLRSHGIKVANIEDLGEGARHADVVVNAIYPESESLPRHYFGPDYFCARDEFLFHPQKEVSNTLSSVLLSFGGVDPNNLTLKVLQAIYPFCQDNQVKIQVVLGLGYQNEDSLKDFPHIEICRNVKSISDYMYANDVAFSSAGRTIYELALVGTPSIVLAQNERELTHFFASEENGFLHLGLGVNSTADAILNAFKQLHANASVRKEMHDKMMRHHIRDGRKKVIRLIRELFENE